MSFLDGYAIDVSGGILNIRLMNLESLLTPEEQFLTSGSVRMLAGRFESDPFPDVLKEQVSRVLYEVNNSLLQKRILPWGGVRDMMIMYDHEIKSSLENSNLCGMLHHTKIKYPTWREEWDMIGV